MQHLLDSLQAHLPHLQFRSGDTFYWSPETKEIYYAIDATDVTAQWSLLHETGHALLEHKDYHTDIELLKIEVAAWERAGLLAKQFGVSIDPEHVQDCLDTYRDWLHARAICPTCTTRCLQHADKQQYRCHNCHTTWRVSSSRFCRTYRTVSGSKKVPVFAVNI